jgi:hypothetical protein
MIYDFSGHFDIAAIGIIPLKPVQFSQEVGSFLAFKCNSGYHHFQWKLSNQHDEPTKVLLVHEAKELINAVGIGRFFVRFLDALANGCLLISDISLKL